MGQRQRVDLGLQTVSKGGGDSEALCIVQSYLSLLAVGQLPLQSGLLGLPVGGQLQPLVLLHHLLVVQLPGFILEVETTPDQQATSHLTQ